VERLEFGCQRLVEAEHRFNDRDAILDAVTGLEGILLAGDKTRDGLRFRFGLAAASLLPLLEGQRRLDRFAEACDLYLARSELAHSGGSLEPQDIDGKKRTGTEIANQARGLLRETIHHFLLVHDEQVPLSKGDARKYWTSFWERRFFGLANVKE
jgi:hypothetical protein